MTLATRPLSVDRRLLIIDAVTLAAAAAGLLLLLLGSIRRPIAGTFISVGWQHAWFFAAAVAALRHVWQPSPSILASLRHWSAAMDARPALADALLAFWLTRPTVLVVGFLAIVTIGLSPRATRATGNPLDSLANRFDAGWYAGIAADGYEWQYRFDRQQNIAFFPAYPILLRVVGFVSGAFQAGLPSERRIARLAWTGTLIAAAAFFCACWYFSALAREFLDPARASAAVLLLAAYPFSVFYSAAYTESLYLLAALGAWYHFRRRDWIIAAMWGLVAGLTRPNGFFLSLPLGLLALGVRDAGRAPQSAVTRSASPWIPLTVAFAPVAGMLLYTTYLYWLTRVWFAWARMHGAWGRVLGSTPELPDQVWSGGDGLVRSVIQHPYETMNSAGLLFAIGLTYAVFRRIGAPWAIFVLATILPPLAAGGVLSMGRLTSTLFPLFLALAALLPPRAALACATAFGVLQGLAAALFFTWRELY